MMIQGLIASHSARKVSFLEYTFAHFYLLIMDSRPCVVTATHRYTHASMYSK